MKAGIEIVGNPGDYEAAAIVAAIHAVMAEEEARARRLSTTSRWRVELPEFERGRWGVAHPAGSPPLDGDD